MSEEVLQIAEERREAISRGEGERYPQLNAEFQRTATTDKKAFFSEQSKKWRKTTERVRVNINILKPVNEYGWEWVNLTQMTIISTIVGKNPIKETE